MQQGCPVLSIRLFTYLSSLFPAPAHAELLTNPKAVDAFKNHISFMANRTNSVNGVSNSDMTIFSWNLMNEPRFFGNATTCQNDAKKCQDEFQSW